MTLNVGTPDRIIRLILGIALIIAPFVTGWALFANALWMWAALIVGGVLVITAIVRFCPAYRIAGITTAQDKRP